MALWEAPLEHLGSSGELRTVMSLSEVVSGHLGLNPCKIDLDTSGEYECKANNLVGTRHIKNKY